MKKHMGSSFASFLEEKGIRDDVELRAQKELRSRQELVRSAAALVERLSIGWMAVEGAISVSSGVIAGSAALTGFGVDSAIELVAGIIVYRRFKAEIHGVDQAAASTAERRARAAIGLTLFALAAYILLQSAWSLWKHQHPESSSVGLVVTCIALIAMPLLALVKRRLGRAVGSRALIRDAHESLACAWLSAAAVLGVGLNGLFGWWWADPVAALVMVPFLVHEGREALEEPRQGAEGCHDEG